MELVKVPGRREQIALTRGGKTFFFPRMYMAAIA
jgi:hypothetical protein